MKKSYINRIMDKEENSEIKNLWNKIEGKLFYGYRNFGQLSLETIEAKNDYEIQKEWIKMCIYFVGTHYKKHNIRNENYFDLVMDLYTYILEKDQYQKVNFTYVQYAFMGLLRSQHLWSETSKYSEELVVLEDKKSKKYEDLYSELYLSIILTDLLSEKEKEIAIRRYLNKESISFIQSEMGYEKRHVIDLSLKKIKKIISKIFKDFKYKK